MTDINIDMSPLIKELQKRLKIIEEALAEEPPNVELAKKLLSILRDNLPSDISANLKH